MNLYGSSRIGSWKPGIDISAISGTSVWGTAGNKYYELSNHLGNVLAVITDVRNLVSGEYEPEVSSAQDYYPFGMVMPGRNFDSGEYRYGFNGKENDNDVGKGIGNQQDYGMRIYDARLGRFLSVDPIAADYPELAPYQFASNRPIDGIDLDGLEYTRAQLINLLQQAKAAIGTISSDNSISTRGWADAMLNANTLGFTDAFGGTDNTHKFTGRDLKTYLWGRVIGDATAIIQGGGEVSGGLTAAGVGGAASLTGGGAIVGVPYAIGGLAVAGHGALTGVTAASDLTETLGQLRQLSAMGDNSANQSSKTQDASSQASASSPQTASQRYPGVAADYGSRTASQLRKTIASTKKTIAEHLGYLKNPLSKAGMTAEKWAAMGDQARKGLLNKWVKDIDRNKAYLEIAENALKTKH